MHDGASPRGHAAIAVPAPASPAVAQAFAQATPAVRPTHVPLVGRRRVGRARSCAIARDASSGISNGRISSSPKPGSPRPILDFRAQADGPVKLAMLFDISGSMRVGSKAVDARQAARHVFGALEPATRRRVSVRHAARPGHAVHVRSARRSRRRWITSQSPFGQTSLYDAVAETARRSPAEGPGGGRMPQRSAVVVLTDGIDTRSRLTPGAGRDDRRAASTSRSTSSR